MIVYQGPSMLTGAPIVMIATGFNGSSNEKTGAELIQTYILTQEEFPAAAARNGNDSAICGDCVQRGTFDATGERTAGSRLCYVNLGQGVLIVYKAYLRGIYEVCPEGNLANVFENRLIRMGTYGDPAAVPAHIWRAMLSRSKGRTGYTHQWRNPATDWLKPYVMASADSLQDAADAQSMGWRTFRVAPSTGWHKESNESLCPASAEGGKVTTCDHCLLCSGTSGKGSKSIMIPDHSTQGRAAKKRAGITFKRNGVVV